MKKKEARPFESVTPPLSSPSSLVTAICGRPEAKEALKHPWILSGLKYSEEELWYPPDQKHASSRSSSLSAEEEHGNDQHAKGGGAVGLAAAAEVGGAGGGGDAGRRDGNLSGAVRVVGDPARLIDDGIVGRKRYNSS